MKDFSLYKAEPGKKYYITEMRSRGLNFYRGESQMLGNAGFLRGNTVEIVRELDGSNTYIVRINDELNQLLSEKYSKKIFVTPDKEDVADVFKKKNGSIEDHL